MRTNNCIKVNYIGHGANDLELTVTVVCMHNAPRVRVADYPKLMCKISLIGPNVKNNEDARTRKGYKVQGEELINSCRPV